MEQIRFERIGEEMFHQVLDNGLNVFVFPKPEFQKKYAFFATNYGGMDLRFRLDGTWHDTPPEWPTTWSTKCSTPERATRSSS